MSMNDPLGDMLTRIRNAQMRRKGKVSTPGSRLRAHVLEVLQQEGYIRSYSSTDFGNGRTEFEIELKYHEGQPVIRQIERVSKPGRRVYSAVDAMPLFYDNYFVPRGYAFVAVDLPGTGQSEGCPDTGGPAEIARYAATECAQVVP